MHPSQNCELQRVALNNCRDQEEPLCTSAHVWYWIEVCSVQISISFSRFGRKHRSISNFTLFCKIILVYLLSNYGGMVFQNSSQQLAIDSSVITYLELSESIWSSLLRYSLITLQLISILWRMSNIWLMDMLLFLKYKRIFLLDFHHPNQLTLQWSHWRCNYNSCWCDLQTRLQCRWWPRPERIIHTFTYLLLLNTSNLDRYLSRSSIM